MDALTPQLLALLRRDGRMSYADMARRLGSHREAVASKITPLLDSGALQVVAAAHPHVQGLQVAAHLAFKVHGDEQPLLAALQADESVGFLSLNAGAYPIVAESWHRDMADLAHTVRQLRQVPGVGEVQVLLYERVVRSFFGDDRPAPIATKLDATDQALVAQLQRHARASYAELAAPVGLSISGCRTRVQRLLAHGVLQIGAVPQRAHMDHGILLGLGLHVRGDPAPVEALLQTHLGLEFMARSVGRFDMVATLAFDGLRAANLLLERVRALPEVAYCEQWLHLQILRERYGRVPAGAHLEAASIAFSR